ncbi:MAG: histidine triad nucleotide-binding protein, partial [Methylococcaceae bacterium]
MTVCLFCNMVSGEIKPDTVYEDENILAFRDINPQAP